MHHYYWNSNKNINQFSSQRINFKVPYKTLLLSVQDTAGGVVREMVEKYGLPKSEAPHFCLVQSNLSMPEDGAPGVVVGGGTTREYILDDDDCPLNILMNHQVELLTIKSCMIWDEKHNG